MCLTACYLSMFSSYAKELQNDGVILEKWLKNKSKWEYLWKESISHWDTNVEATQRGSIEEQGYSIPHDLVEMVKNNQSMIKSVQKLIDRTSFGNDIGSPWKKSKGGKGTGGGQQKKQQNQWKGGGGENGGGHNATGFAARNVQKKGKGKNGKGGKGGKK